MGVPRSKRQHEGSYLTTTKKPRQSGPSQPRLQKLGLTTGLTTDDDDEEIDLSKWRSERGDSGYFGVTSYRGKFKAQRRIDGKLRHLGMYDTAEEAARAVAAASARHNQEVDAANDEVLELDEEKVRESKGTKHVRKVRYGSSHDCDHGAPPFDEVYIHEKDGITYTTHMCDDRAVDDGFYSSSPGNRCMLYYAKSKHTTESEFLAKRIPEELLTLLETSVLAYANYRATEDGAAMQSNILADVSSGECVLCVFL